MFFSNNNNQKEKQIVKSNVFELDIVDENLKDEVEKMNLLLDLLDLEVREDI